MGKRSGKKNKPKRNHHSEPSVPLLNSHGSLTPAETMPEIEPSIPVIASEQRNITVLSLDYDGCGALLFEDVFNGIYKELYHSINERHLKTLETILQGAIAAFEEMLLIETAGADVVELCVGSARQSRKQDRGSSKNGLCFEMYADLAEKNLWHFNRMLLADFIDETGRLRAKPLEPGTAMGPLEKNKQGMYKYIPDALADTLSEPLGDKYKRNLLQHQIKTITNKYPNDKIKFVFIDDIFEIIDSLRSHFSSKSQSSMRCNVEKLELKLIHCNIDVKHLLMTYYRMDVVDVSRISDLAKTMINCVITFPRQDQTLTYNAVNKKTQEAIASMGWFSKFNKLGKETASSSVINYGFICQALGLIGVCLAIVAVGRIFFVNTHRSDNELPEHEMVPSF
ncbi:MAG: hypothetical protein Q8R24_05045 [Legionellaceae bacterium]|nr:hypothetical protein [Legionellaceae bacterium]